MDFETKVKLTIYKMVAEEAVVPNSESVGLVMDVPGKNIEAAFLALAAKRLLVLEPGNPSKIRMAPPFSGVETPFKVEIGDKSYFANCVWDAFGIAAALQMDGHIFTSDGYTGEPLHLEIKDNQPAESTCLAHFAEPAAHWWDDIIHT